MTKTYKNDVATMHIPEDPPSVKKAKDELQALIDADASADDISAKRSEIRRLYRFEDDKAAGLVRSKKGLRK